VVTADRIGPLRSGARSSELRTFLGKAVYVLGGLLIVVATAWFEVQHGAKVVAAAVGVAAVAVVLIRRAYGVMLGVAVLMSMNGIPGVDVNPGGVAISHLQDLAGLGVLGGSFYVVASGKVAQRSSLQRMLYVASFALAAWWLVTWARTAALNGVPPTLAAKFARDFLFFALTLPLLCDVFVTYPRLRRQVLWTLGAGAFLFAVAQIVQSRTNISLNFIIHPLLSTVVQGTTRVYSPMTSLVRAAFALSCGALILAPTQRLRRRAVAPALLFGMAMVLQLTRAAYFGAAVGFVLAGSFWWFRRSPIRDAARKQLILVPLLAICLLGLGATVSSGERHLFSTVATRALAGYSDVNSTSGTVAVRVDVGKEMLRLLGQDWPIGVGFMHPAAHPYPSLPNGSIRDGDLGVLNVLMLMGAVGAVLLYLPLLLVGRGLVRASPALESTVHGDEWLRLGATIWIIGVVASSLTLVDLFSFGGLELSACMLAMAASVAVSRVPHAQPVEPPSVSA
jgi:hypothetical protein